MLIDYFNPIRYGGVSQTPPYHIIGCSVQGDGSRHLQIHWLFLSTYLASAGEEIFLICCMVQPQEVAKV